MYIGPFLFVYILHVCLHPPLAMWQCFEKPLPVETLLPLDPTIWVIDDFVLAYDKRNRTAHWVFEHLTREKVKRYEGIDRESSQFKPDNSVHEYFRATNEDYKKSGYDRGHLAAAGNHRWSQQALDQTFHLSNIAPQVNC